MIHNTWYWSFVNQAVKQAFPKKHLQYKQKCPHVAQRRLYKWIRTVEGSVQKLRVLVTSWGNTLSNCRNLAIVQQGQIKQRKPPDSYKPLWGMLSHLWVYLIISFTVMRLLARHANSCHDFSLLKTSCWLVLLASLGFAVSLLQKMFWSLIILENNCFPRASVCNSSWCFSSVEMPCDTSYLTTLIWNEVYI